MANNRTGGVVIKNWVRKDSGVKSDVQQQADQAQMREDMEREIRAYVQADMNAQVQATLSQAQARAEELLSTTQAQAQSDAEALRTQAQKEGYAQGLAQAQQEIRNQIDQAQQAFDHFLAALQDQKPQAEAFLQDNILKIAIAIAEKILPIALEQDDKVFRDLVKSAVERLSAKENFVIRVSQVDYERYFAQGDGWLADALPTAPFTVSVGSNLSQGDCLLESSSGRVDAGVQGQMERIKDALEAADGTV